jgi:hypothetical protein
MGQIALQSARSVGQRDFNLCLLLKARPVAQISTAANVARVIIFVPDKEIPTHVFPYMVSTFSVCGWISFIYKGFYTSGYLFVKIGYIKLCHRNRHFFRPASMAAAQNAERDKGPIPPATHSFSIPEGKQVTDELSINQPTTTSSSPRVNPSDVEYIEEYGSGMLNFNFSCIHSK